MAELSSNLAPNFLELAPTVGKSQSHPLAGSAKAQSYQNVNLLHGHSPVLPAFKKTSRGSKTYVDSYGTTHVSREQSNPRALLCNHFWVLLLRIFFFFLLLSSSASLTIC